MYAKVSAACSGLTQRSRALYDAQHNREANLTSSRLWRVGDLTIPIRRADLLIVDIVGALHETLEADLTGCTHGGCLRYRRGNNSRN
jgi:hypothetical protein